MPIPSAATTFLGNLEAESWFVTLPTTVVVTTYKIHIPQQASFKSCGTFITFWPRCRGIYERHFRLVCCPPTSSLVKPCGCSQVHFNFLVEWCRCDVLGGFATITTEKMIHRAQGDRKEHNSSPDWNSMDSVLRITSAGLATRLMETSAQFIHH